MSERDMSKDFNGNIFELRAKLPLADIGELTPEQIKALVVRSGRLIGQCAVMIGAEPNATLRQLEALDAMVDRLSDMLAWLIAHRAILDLAGPLTSPPPRQDGAA